MRWSLTRGPTVAIALLVAALLIDAALTLHNIREVAQRGAVLRRDRPLQDAYATARTAITARTATTRIRTGALARAAFALGRSREGIEALRRAVSSSEPVPNVYEDLIVAHEGAGNLPAALEWTDQASKTFGGAPRWMPHKIRLLRKGRVRRRTATIDCSLKHGLEATLPGSERDAGRPRASLAS